MKMKTIKLVKITKNISKAIWTNFKWIFKIIMYKQPLKNYVLLSFK